MDILPEIIEQQQELLLQLKELTDIEYHGERGRQLQEAYLTLDMRYKFEVYKRV